MDNQEKATLHILLVGDTYPRVFTFKDFDQYSDAISAVFDQEEPPVFWCFEHCEGETYIPFVSITLFTGCVPQSVKDAWVASTE